MAYTPAGPEFRLDAATEGHQYYPDVAVDGLGNGVAVWAAENVFRTDFEIMARRLDAVGNPAGDPFVVNQTPTGHLYYGPARWPEQSVAAWPDGRFVVVWQKATFSDNGTADHGDDTGRNDLLARIYGPTGAPLTDEFAVNTASHGRYNPTPAFESIDGMEPSVVVASDSTLVFVWAGVGPATGDNLPQGYARRFDATGHPLGEEFLIHPAVPTGMNNPEAAPWRDGGFVVAWDGYSGDPASATDVYLQRFDADDAPVGETTAVSSSPEGDERNASVATDGGGNITVAWEDYAPRAAAATITARRFDAGAHPDGEDFLVSPDGAEVDVDVTPNGQSAFTWRAMQGQFDTDIKARWYNFDHSIAGETMVMDQAAPGPWAPAVAMRDDGDTVVVYTGQLEAHYDGIFARWAALNPAPVASPIPDVEVPEDTPTATVDLRAAFSDPGDTLSYQVSGTGDATIIQTIRIDPAAGTLTLVLGPDLHGEAMVTVRATDSAGSSAQSTFRLTILSVNDAPRVSLSAGPSPVEQGRDLTLSAGVTDADGADPAAVVRFYRESNGTPGLQIGGDGGAAGDTLVGSVTGGPFALTVPTAGLSGAQRFYAQATDGPGAAGNVAQADAFVLADQPGAPQVAGAFVRNPYFQGTVGTNYPVPGGAGQLRSIPWLDFGAIGIQFTEPVRADVNDLVVRGVNTARYPIVRFFYDPLTYTAWWYWQTGNDLTSERYTLELNADGTDGVKDLSGASLDGEWSNGADAYPSGDGTPGGVFVLRLNRLPGDATGDGRVNAFDLADVKVRLNTSATQPGTGAGAYSIYADVDSNGKINASDLAIVKSRLNRQLPDGEPARLASDLAPIASTAPVSSTRELLDEDGAVI
jgi:hypothetical protein